METLKIEQIKTSQKFIAPARVQYWKEKILKGEQVRVRVHISDGAYYVLDGNHRLEAYKALKIEAVPVNILTGKELTKYIFKR